MNKNNNHITLEDIRLRKREKLLEIRASGMKMKGTVRSIFTPSERQQGVNGLMQNVGKGIAIYDGVMTGIKIIRKIRKTFNRKRF